MSFNATPQIVPGLGTLLKMGNGDGPPETFTTIGQRVSIDGPDIEVGKVETTNLDNTVKQYRPTLPDGGELQMTIEFDPTYQKHEDLYALITSKAIKNWELVFAVAGPNNTWTFPGFLTKFSPTGMEVEGNLEANVTLQLNGVPVLS